MVSSRTVMHSSSDIPRRKDVLGAIDRREFIQALMGLVGTATLPAYAKEAESEEAELLASLDAANAAARRLTMKWIQDARLSPGTTNITVGQFVDFSRELALELHAPDPDLANRVRRYISALARPDDPASFASAESSHKAFLRDHIAIIPNEITQPEGSLFWRVTDLDMPPHIRSSLEGFFTPEEIRRTGEVPLFSADQPASRQAGYTDTFFDTIIINAPSAIAQFSDSIPVQWQHRPEDILAMTLANEYIQVLLTKGMRFNMDLASLPVPTSYMPSGSVNGMNLLEHISDAGSLSVNPLYFANLTSTLVAGLYITPEGKLDFDAQLTNVPGYEFSTRVFFLKLQELPQFPTIESILRDLIVKKEGLTHKMDSTDRSDQVESEWQQLRQAHIRALLEELRPEDIARIRETYAANARFLLGAIRRSTPQTPTALPPLPHTPPAP